MRFRVPLTRAVSSTLSDTLKRVPIRVLTCKIKQKGKYKKILTKVFLKEKFDIWAENN